MMETPLISAAVAPASCGHNIDDDFGALHLKVHHDVVMAYLQGIAMNSSSWWFLKP